MNYRADEGHSSLIHLFNLYILRRKRKEFTRKKASCILIVVIDRLCLYVQILQCLSLLRQIIYALAEENYSANEENGAKEHEKTCIMTDM